MQIMTEPAELSPLLTEVNHGVVDYARNRYAGHPRQGGIFNFGGRRDRDHLQSRPLRLPQLQRRQAWVGRLPRAGADRAGALV